ncbi:MAG: MBOAT family protein [Sphingobacteriales bacterium]|nr:MBOAT family protein [Sphingobacteriales bacterium]
MIVLDYNIALYLERLQAQWARKLLLGLSIILSLSFLLYFKYSGFLADILNQFTGSGFRIDALFLPIGISFYTFQSISYIVDVYTKKIHSSNSFVDYAFYMTFFPHLVAGPIVRAKDFIPQVNQPMELTKKIWSEGFFRIAIGLTKKLLFADFLAKYVDMVHTNPSLYSGFENLMSMYAYAFQIYFDFSGYSDIAIGIAILLGYRLKENFDNPYRATNITEFWRKWHISLSSWLKDYIYIPLGGNRKGKVNTYLFLLITMTIGGIWHGANWKFIVWGIAHGLALAIHKLVVSYLQKNKAATPSIWSTLWSGLVTFHLVAFLWILFRAESFQTAFSSMELIWSKTNFTDAVGFFVARKEFVYLFLLSAVVIFSPSIFKLKLAKWFESMPFILVLIIFLCLLQLILQFKSQDIQPFIYFQF